MMRHILEYISTPAPIGRKSSAELIRRNGGRMAVCAKVLNTPHLAECRTRQTCGIFTSIGFQWPGSAIVEQQPAMAKATGRLDAVFKYLAAPLNKGRSLNKHLGNPMNTPSQGAIRPQSVPSLETLSNVLATVDAVAALLEHALQHPSSITPVWARGLSAQFKNLAGQIDGVNFDGLDNPEVR